MLSLYSACNRWLNVSEALVKWYWHVKTEVLGEKPVSLPLWSTQILHGLARDRTHVSAATDRQGVAGDLPSEAWHGPWISEQHAVLLTFVKAAVCKTSDHVGRHHLSPIQHWPMFFCIEVTQNAVRTLPRQTRCSRGRLRRCTERLKHLHGAWTQNTVRRKTSTPVGIFPITRLEWCWHLGPNPYNRKCTPHALTERESCTATVLRPSLCRVSTNMIRRLCLCYREGGSLPTSHVTLHVFIGLVSLRNIHVLYWKRPKRL